MGAETGSPVATIAEAGADSAEDARLRDLGYKPELARVLGGASSFAIQFSTICFSGAIIVGLSVGFGQIGPLTLWTFAVACALQLVVALCIAELTSAYPVAGGVYQVVTRQGGRFLGWQTGWMIQIAHICSLGVGAVGLTPIIMAWFGVTDLSHWESVGVAAVIIFATTCVNLMRVRVVAIVNNIGVGTELLASAVVIFGCIIAWLFFGKHHNGVSFLTHSQGVAGDDLLLPVLYSVLLAAFIVSGFDVSGTAGEETHDASRQVPKQAIRANIATLVIGTLVLLMLMLAVPSVQGTLDSESPVRYILTSVLGSPLARVFEILAVLALLVNGMVLQLAGARVLWAQARDGAFLGAGWIRKVNRERVPSRGVIVAGLVAFAVTLYSSLFNILAAMLAVSWAAAYMLALMVGLRSRMRGELPDRPYVLRGGNFWYALAIVWSAFIVFILVYQTPGKVGLGTLGIIVVGLVLYLSAGKERRRAAAEGPATTTEPVRADVPV